MRAISIAVAGALFLIPGLSADEPVQWTYQFVPRQRIEYEVSGTYHATGLSTQRIVPKGDSDGGGSIGGPGGEGMSVSNGGPPPIGVHDGGGSSSFHVVVEVDEVDAKGKAKCSVQLTKMTGKFDSPGMAGRTLPICLFPQFQLKPFRAELAPDGGKPTLVDFDPFVREVLGADVVQARIDLIVRETERALAACLPALPEMPGKTGASYKVGDVTYVVGPQKIIDQKKAILVAGNGPDFDRDSDQGKSSTREKGGYWQRFYFAFVTRLSEKYEEKHWRTWSQKTHNVLGNRTDMEETITYAASLVRSDVPKPEPGERNTEKGDGQK